MSAALETTFAPVTLLDQLSNADPTSADLRARAAFWRRYVETTPGLTSDQVARIEASCVALIARADHMDAPAPVVALVHAAPPQRRGNVLPRVAKPKAAPAMTAEQFWTLHGRAVAQIRACLGENWYSHTPRDSVTLTVPSKLCSMTGPLGGKIKWRRDWRMPAAQYWPGGALPDCGLDVAPEPCDQGPLPGDGVAEIVAEQIKQDKRFNIIRKARVAHTRACEGGCGSFGLRGSAYHATSLARAAEIRRELASALFDWKVSVGLVDGAEYGVDAERELAGEA